MFVHHFPKIKNERIKYLIQTRTREITYRHEIAVSHFPSVPVHKNWTKHLTIKEYPEKPADGKDNGTSAPYQGSGSNLGVSLLNVVYTNIVNYSDAIRWQR